MRLLGSRQFYTNYCVQAYSILLVFYEVETIGSQKTTDRERESSMCGVPPKIAVGHSRLFQQK